MGEVGVWDARAGMAHGEEASGALAEERVDWGAMVAGLDGVKH